MTVDNKAKARDDTGKEEEGRDIRRICGSNERKEEAARTKNL